VGETPLPFYFYEMDEERKKQGEKAIANIHRRIQNHSRSFHVNDMPLDKFDLFTKIAKTDFCDHYGLTISFFMDYYLMLSPLIDRVANLETELAKLHSNKPEEKFKGIKMMDGKVIGGKK
jgi:hypothetical protein